MYPMSLWWLEFKVSSSERVPFVISAFQLLWLLKYLCRWGYRGIVQKTKSIGFFVIFMLRRLVSILKRQVESSDGICFRKVILLEFSMGFVGDRVSIPDTEEAIFLYDYILFMWLNGSLHFLRVDWVNFLAIDSCPVKVRTGVLLWIFVHITKQSFTMDEISD